MTNTENKKVYISNLKPTSGDSLAGSLNIDDIISKMASGEIKPFVNSKGQLIIDYFFSAKKEMDNWGNTHYLVHNPKTVDVDREWLNNKMNSMMSKTFTRITEASDSVPSDDAPF